MKRMDAVIYIHGKGGNAAEAEHYNLLFSSCNVIGLEYKGFTPWEAGMEIHAAVAELNAEYDRIILIANSLHTEEQMQFLDNWLKNKLDS